MKHLHTYQRLKSNKKRYKCIHPDCNHISFKELILGKRASCNGCLNAFILDKSSLRLASPKCENCRKARKIKDTVPLISQQGLENILKL